MTIKFSDVCGALRTGKEVICRTCSKVFATRNDQTAKYCSTACSHVASRRQIKTKCGHCHKELWRMPSKIKVTKSGYVFCNRACKEAAQKEGTIKAILPPHYGTGEPRYREVFLRAGGVLKCVRCGYAEFDCSIDVHHQDGDHSNNTLSNLVALCSNCHRGIHWRQDTL